jgi:ribosome-binding protein aMBF1 (putative translation factor)
MTTRKAQPAVQQPPTLQQARERLGWSVEQLSLESLVSASLIHRLEEGIAGKVPSLTIGRLSEALGVNELSIN